MRGLKVKLLLCLSLARGNVSVANETQPLRVEIDRDIAMLCDQFSSYMIDENSDCIDLSYLTEGAIPGFENFSRDQYQLLARFKTKLTSLGVPVQVKACEDEPNYLGYYNPVENEMVICQRATNSPEQYLETLIHESWHTVQDCIGGFKDSEVIAVSEVYPDFFSVVLSQSTLENWNTTLNQYPDEQQVSELEARFMEDHPEAVIKGLDICKQ